MEKSNLRLNAERKVSTNIFDVKIGTINRLNPMAVYIEGKGFITPNEESEDYSLPISNIKHTFKKAINDGLNKNRWFDKRFILDFDVATNGIKLTKNSFLTFQVTLKQKSVEPLQLKVLKEKVQPFISDIVDTLGESIETNNFTIKKTRV